MPKSSKKRVNIYVDESIHKMAQAKAEKEGFPLSFVLTKLMDQYAEGKIKLFNHEQ
jgi:hypothetical protein